LQQDQQAKLEAAFHESLDPRKPLELDRDFKSQNYRYHQVSDQASSSVRLGWRKDALVEATATQQASRSERVQTYVDGDLKDESLTPSSASRSRNLLGMIEDAFEQERLSLRDHGVSILEAHLQTQRQGWLLKVDPLAIG
jgi:hypothetical protein